MNEGLMKHSNQSDEEQKKPSPETAQSVYLSQMDAEDDHGADFVSPPGLATHFPCHWRWHSLHRSQRADFGRSLDSRNNPKHLLGLLALGRVWMPVVRHLSWTNSTRRPFAEYSTMAWILARKNSPSNIELIKSSEPTRLLAPAPVATVLRHRLDWAPRKESTNTQGLRIHGCLAALPRRFSKQRSSAAQGADGTRMSLIY